MDQHPAPNAVPSPTPGTRPAARPWVRGLRAAAALTATLALGGCGLRLETPPPAEPAPDAIEQVRARTVDDALDLAAAASALSATTSDDAVRGVLDDVAAFSGLHAQELGGVYDSGLPEATPTPAATPTATPAVTDVTALLGELVDDAARATDDADDVPDGALARLVASVGVARDGLADRLAAATGVTRPEPSSEGTATPTPTPGPTADPSPAAEPVPDGAAALALAHDEAAWASTVLAARASGDERATLLADAARHRAASDAWARTADVAGRPSDPRRAAYALPDGLDDPTVVQTLRRTLEQAVADASAAVVAGSPAGGRADAIASLREATAAAVGRGAAPVPFPGMPEMATVTVD